MRPELLAVASWLTMCAGLGAVFALAYWLEASWARFTAQRAAIARSQASRAARSATCHRGQS